MGKPGWERSQSRLKASEPRELKHLSTWRQEKSTEMPLVAASETGRAQTGALRGAGVVGPTFAYSDVRRSLLEWSAIDGESPVAEDNELYVVEFLSNARNEEPGVKPGGPPSKAKDSRVTDSERVP